MCLIRNEVLKQSGMTFPKPVKTGTTIAGCVFKVSDYDGVEVTQPPLY